MKIKNLGWLNTVWRINTVNPLAKSLEDRHIAPFPDEIPNRLIQMYSEKDECVLDPFCGSGTTNFMAIRLGRRTIGYDIEEKYVEIAKKRCGSKGTFYCKSSETMEEIDDNSIQLCVASPPYLHLRKYSQNPDNIANLQNPYSSLDKVFRQVFRVLKPNGHFCLNVSDVPKPDKKHFTTFPYDLIYCCKKIGFKLKNSIIWDKDVTLREWNLKYKRMMTNHEYIWILQK
jgi:site-specific DNA-methyltransferase (adenine-specific)